MTQLSTHVHKPAFIAADDLYAILEIAKDATKDEIEAAYKRLAKVFHPDMPACNEERFLCIKKAHAILSDEQLRSVYDTTGIIAGENKIVDEAHMLLISLMADFAENRKPEYRENPSFLVSVKLRTIRANATEVAARMESWRHNIELTWRDTPLRKGVLHNLKCRAELATQSVEIIDEAIKILKETAN